MKITSTVSLATLRRATTLAESIERQQNELNALLKGQTVTRKGSKSVSKCAKGSGRFSPEQRAAISAGLKAKWAQRKAALVVSAPAVPVGTPVGATS